MKVFFFLLMLLSTGVVFATIAKSFKEFLSLTHKPHA